MSKEVREEELNYCRIHIFKDDHREFFENVVVIYPVKSDDAILNALIQKALNKLKACGLQTIISIPSLRLSRF